MYSANVRYQFHLYWRKVILLLLLGVGLLNEADAQRNKVINNPDYDNRKLITYGFSIGIHSSGLQIKYKDVFSSPAFDSIHSISPAQTAGFSLGFIVNMNALQFLDLRLVPRVSFYEYKLEFNFINGTKIDPFVESTMVELPLLFKYKSERRGNYRMYLAGGVAPGIEASGKNDLEDVTKNLNITDFNMALEFAVGIDIYYPLFKFSPEIRYSRGIKNVIKNQDNVYTKGLKWANTNNISFFFLFQ